SPASTAPWNSGQSFAAVSPRTNQRSLAFTSVPGGMDLPCYFELDSSDKIVTYTVTSVDQPVPYLFSVIVKTLLETTPEDTATCYFRDDPEMVVSPDGGPGGPPPVSRR